MIEAGLQQLVTSDPRFSSLAATRLYPLTLPTDSPLPAATYQSVTTTPLYALESRVNLDKLRLQVDTYADTYSEAKALAAAVVAILSDYTGTLADGSRVSGVQLANSTDLFEDETLEYHVLLEFYVQFSA